MENHPFLWRRIRRVRRIQVCMARKGLFSYFWKSTKFNTVKKFPFGLKLSNSNVILFLGPRKYKN